MAQFFFDFIEDGELAPDPEGLDLADSAAARTEAAKALAEFASEAIEKRTHCEIQIQVRSVRGTVLLTLHFSLWTQ